MTTGPKCQVHYRSALLEESVIVRQSTRVHYTTSASIVQGTTVSKQILFPLVYYCVGYSHNSTGMCLKVMNLDVLYNKEDTLHYRQIN